MCLRSERAWISWALPLASFAYSYDFYTIDGAKVMSKCAQGRRNADLKCILFVLHPQCFFTIQWLKTRGKEKQSKSVWVVGGCILQYRWEWQWVSARQMKVISIFLMPYSFAQVDRLKEICSRSKELSSSISVTLPVRGCYVKKSLSTSGYDISTTNKGHSK